MKRYKNIFVFGVNSNDEIHQIKAAEEVKEQESNIKLVKVKKQNGKYMSMKWEKFLSIYKLSFMMAFNY